uniref:Uncharacterized protein n=1 Tax=Panagrolaimus davidi TaxID=227884 RepID=A0A914PEP3_9BILA
MQQANQAGFNGGLVVDFPNSSKAKKIYLVLMTGGMQKLPRALTEEEPQSSHIKNIERREVRPNSKYTGRKRHKKF